MGGHYKYIDALRGYAILMVVMVHTSQHAPAIADFIKQIASQGARGVQLFFVLSALTLMMSWNVRQDGAFYFYIRRLFRIVPMFWLAIVFYVWRSGGVESGFLIPHVNDVGDVIFTFLFLHGFRPETFNVIVSGGWSIAVEMTFYAIFPLLMIFVRDWRSVLVFFVVAVFIGEAGYRFLFEHRAEIWPGVDDGLVSSSLTFGIIKQLSVFATGFILYYFLERFQGIFSKKYLSLLFVVSVFTGIAYAFYPFVFDRIYLNVYLVYGILFAVVTFCLAEGVFPWMVNKVICYIGTVSYSMYLVHFIIIWAFERLLHMVHFSADRNEIFYVLFFLATVAVSVCVSTVTYRLVEQPMIAAGRRVIQLLKEKRSAGLKGEEFV